MSRMPIDGDSRVHGGVEPHCDANQGEEKTLVVGLRGQKPVSPPFHSTVAGLLSPVFRSQVKKEASLQRLYVHVPNRRDLCSCTFHDNRPASALELECELFLKLA